MKEILFFPRRDHSYADPAIRTEGKVKLLLSTSVEHLLKVIYNTPY